MKKIVQINLTIAQLLEIKACLKMMKNFLAYQADRESKSEIAKINRILRRIEPFIEETIK